MSGAKIIEGLKEAIAGDFASVLIEGQRWVRVTPMDKLGIINMARVESAGDIVEQLRTSSTDLCSPDGCCYGNTMEEAATVIERLRAVLTFITTSMLVETPTENLLKGKLVLWGCAGPNKHALAIAGNSYDEALIGQIGTALNEARELLGLPSSSFVADALIVQPVNQ